MITVEMLDKTIAKLRNLQRGTHVNIHDLIAEVEAERKSVKRALCEAHGTLYSCQEPDRRYLRCSKCGEEYDIPGED